MFLSLHCAFVLFFSRSCALFMGPASTFFSKNNFKIGSHGTIHIFKNYFVIVFSVFSNKRYPNKPYIISHFKGVEEVVIVTCVFCLGDIGIKTLVIGLTFSLALMIPKNISR